MYFIYWDSVVTHGARCTREIKSRNFMAKAAFSNYNPLFTSNLDVRKKLAKCYIWSIALCGAETWTFRREY